MTQFQDREQQTSVPFCFWECFCFSEQKRLVRFSSSWWSKTWILTRAQEKAWGILQRGVSQIRNNMIKHRNLKRLSSITAELCVDLPLAWGDWGEGKWIFFKNSYCSQYRSEARNHTWPRKIKVKLYFNWPQTDNAFRYLTETNINPLWKKVL